MLRDLVRWADVLVESYTPGVMEAWGLGYEDLRARQPAAGHGQHEPDGPDRPAVGVRRLRQPGRRHHRLLRADRLARPRPGRPVPRLHRLRRPPLHAWPPCSPRSTGGAAPAAASTSTSSQAEASIHFLAPAILDHTVNGVHPTRAGNADRGPRAPRRVPPAPATTSGWPSPARPTPSAPRSAASIGATDRRRHRGVDVGAAGRRGRGRRCRPSACRSTACRTGRLLARPAARPPRPLPHRRAPGPRAVRRRGRRASCCRGRRRWCGGPTRRWASTTTTSCATSSATTRTTSPSSSSPAPSADAGLPSVRCGRRRPGSWPCSPSWPPAPPACDRDGAFCVTAQVPGDLSGDTERGGRGGRHAGGAGRRPRRRRARRRHRARRRRVPVQAAARGVGIGHRGRPRSRCAARARPCIRTKNASGDYGLSITGDHWRIEGLTVAHATKGIVLDGSVGTVIDGVEVFDIGDEGVHFRTLLERRRAAQLVHPRHRAQQPAVRRGRLRRVGELELGKYECTDAVEGERRGRQHRAGADRGQHVRGHHGRGRRPQGGHRQRHAARQRVPPRRRLGQEQRRLGGRCQGQRLADRGQPVARADGATGTTTARCARASSPTASRPTPSTTATAPATRSAATSSTATIPGFGIGLYPANGNVVTCDNQAPGRRPGPGRRGQAADRLRRLIRAGARRPGRRRPAARRASPRRPTGRRRRCRPRCRSRSRCRR